MTSPEQLKSLGLKISDIIQLRPKEQHKVAFTVWARNNKPGLTELATMLGRPTSFSKELKRWRDGTHPCSCQWHRWESKNEVPGTVGVATIPTTAPKKKKEKLEQSKDIDLSSRSDIELLQLGLDSIKPYLQGAEATLPDGTVITIPRLAPRNVTELVNFVDKFLRLKLQLTGGPTEIIDIRMQRDDTPIIELKPDQYQMKKNSQSQELDSLLDELE